MTTERRIFGRADVAPFSDEDAAAELLTDAIQGLWEVVNQLTRFRRTRRQNDRVTIFGSARLQEGTPAYDGVRELAAGLTRLGCDIVTGGGPGSMRAADEGAAAVEPAAPGRWFGIRVHLPFEQETSPFVGPAYEHGRFFSRLHHLILVSAALVVVPGGIGTLLELSLAWQLLQVRRLYDKSLVLIGEMWRDLVEWGRRAMLRPGSELADEVDFAIPHCVREVAAAVALIRTSREARLQAQTAAG